MRANVRRLMGGLLIIGLALGFATEGWAQSTTRPTPVDLFGGGVYQGGYLKYSYKVSREGVSGYSITTTEIIPQEDGMYRVESSSIEVVSGSRVSIGFFGISLLGLGFRIPMSTGGTVDLAPLSALANTVIEPGREYVLPDGAFLAAGESGEVAGLSVVHATYTHADFSNVRVHLAFPVDLQIRNLLPLFPLLELEYEVSQLPERTPVRDETDEPREPCEDEEDGEGTDVPEAGSPTESREGESTGRMRSFSRIELIEFVYEP